MVRGFFMVFLKAGLRRFHGIDSFGIKAAESLLEALLANHRPVVFRGYGGEIEASSR